MTGGVAGRTANFEGVGPRRNSAFGAQIEEPDREKDWLERKVLDVGREPARTEDFR